MWSNSIARKGSKSPGLDYVSRQEFTEFQSRVLELLDGKTASPSDPPSSDEAAAFGRDGAAQVGSDDVIELNVGGTLFYTFLSTLTKHPDSMLAAMFSGRFPLRRDREGRVFLDRNPRYFELVLDYLRTDLYPVGLLPESQVPFFEHEISFFNLQRPASDIAVKLLRMGKALRVDESETMQVRCFDVVGDYLVTGNRDGKLWVWSVRDACKLGEMDAHRKSVTEVRLFVSAQTGTLMALSSSADSKVRLHDVRAHSFVRSFEGHTGSANSIDLMLDSNPEPEDFFVSGCSDGMIRIFNMQTASCVNEWKAPDNPGVFTCVKADGRQVFGAIGSRVLVFDRDKGFLHEFAGPSNVLYFCLHEKSLIVSHANCSIVVYKRGEASLVHTLSGPQYSISRFTVVGQLVVAGSQDGSLVVWSLQTGNCVHVAKTLHSAVVRGVVFRDGVLYTMGADGDLNFWELEQGGGTRNPNSRKASGDAERYSRLSTRTSPRYSIQEASGKGLRKVLSRSTGLNNEDN